MLLEADLGIAREAERNFIQHPAGMPIEVYLQADSVRESVAIPPAGAKGLRFSTNVFLQSGMVVKIAIPVVEPSFEALAWVVWCSKADKGFDVGLIFLDDAESVPIQMVEQICYIKDYKSSVLENEGRVLTTEEAAIEWMRNYAGKFPLLDASTCCH